MRTVKKIYSHFASSSLYRNSIYLMASSFFTAVFGFVFWIINARLFPPSEVGIATTLISTAGFIGEFSLLGLKNGLIRFLPASTIKNKKINTSFAIVTIVTILLSAVFVFFTPRFSGELSFLSKSYFYFLLFVFFVATFSLNQIQEGVFVAYRSTGFVLAKNILWGLVKVSLPLLLFSYGAMGIFSSFSLGSVVSLLFGMFFLTRNFGYKFGLMIDKDSVKQIGKFSIGDYVGLLFSNASSFLMPLIVISHLGAEESAFYYIAMQIASVLFIIPTAINQSLYAEASHNESETRTHLVSSLKLTYAFLLPAILVIVFFGGFVLQVFGKHYSDNALTLLRVIAASGLFVGISSSGNALLHVKKRIGLYALINLASSAITLLSSLVLLKFGLLGVGYAIVLGSATTAFVYLFVLRESLR